MKLFLISLLSTTLIFSGLPVYANATFKGGTNSYLSEETLTIPSSGGTTTLTAATIKPTIVITGTLPHTIILPDATTLGANRAIEFFSQTTGLVTINANGGTLLKNLTYREKSKFKLLTKTTAAGTWAVENNAAVNVATPTYFGGITQNGATGCNYNAPASTGPSDFKTLSDGSGCNAWTVKSGGSGAVAAVATNSQGIVLSNVPAGSIVVKAKGGFNSSNAGSICNWRIFDGTTGYDPQYSYTSTTTVIVPNVEFHIPVSSSASTLTLRIQSAGAAGAACMLDNTASGRNLAFDVYHFPSQSQGAVRMDQTADLMGTTFYSGKATCPANSLPADGTAVSRTTYAGLFNNIGTTFGTGDGSTTFNVPDLRGVFVKGAGSQVISGQTYSGTLGTKQTDQMQSHKHNVVTNSAASGQSAGANSAYAGWNGVVWNSTADHGTGSPVTDGTYGVPRLGNQTHPANISMTPCIWHVSNPAPLVSGGVTSSSAGSSVIEAVTVGTAGSCTTSPCAIDVDGDWVTSVTRFALGAYTVNFKAGYFSKPPKCSATKFINNAAIGLLTDTTTVNSIIVISFGTVSGSAADTSFNLLCKGTR